MPAAPPFSRLARVYDAIMQDVDYDDWVDFILELAAVRAWPGGSVLDLGCGTGNSTRPFVQRGFDTVGLDASREMLDVARAKLPEGRFVHGDFTSFALDERFGLIVSVFDSLNNLLEPSEFVAAAERALEHLAPGGLFVFDMNTTTGLRELWEDDRAEGWAGDIYYRWEHAYDETTGLATVTAYCSDASGDFTEVHTERPYDPPELRALLRRAGFRTVEILAFPNGEPAPDDSDRVWVVARAQA